MAEENPEVQGQAAEETVIEGSEWTSLLQKKVKAKSSREKDTVTAAVQTLAESILKDQALVTDDALKTIRSLIAEIDSKLTAQVNEIIHHEEFQNLEGAWRGLHHMVNNTETDEMLKIKVFNISKKELGKTLKAFKGTMWDQSPIFKKVYEEEFGTLGGEPFGCLVGDFHFDHSPPDVEMLGEIAKISAASHAPFIAGAGANLLKMDSWQELSNPVSITKIFQTPDYAPWKSLRESEDAKYIGLAMPRFLARLPWGSKTEPVEEFDFEEETEGGDHNKYCWANSAYAMAVNINRAFKLYGWCARIRGVESGGGVEGLPAHTFPTDDGGVDMKCPTEISIADRREKELADNGLMPLLHKKNTDFAAFIGAQSLHKPAEYDDPDATANANIGARLPYLFASCRFAHFLKCMVRDKVGGFTSQNELQRWLQKWINQYVLEDPDNAPERKKAEKPLQAAEVEVVEVEGNPGYYTSVFRLKPHYQLEGLTVSLRLVSKLKSEKG